MENTSSVEIPNFLDNLGVSLGKRRSCELVETASPCVKKALFHLKNLQEILNKGGRFKELSTGKKELKFLKEDSIKDEGKDAVLEDLMKQYKKKQEVYTLKSHQEAPKEVFRQVTELILRLEDDRIKTENSLASERSRLNWLDKKLREMMIQRMTTLPQKVQQEHENCARNIGELDWHVVNSIAKKQESLESLASVKAVNDKLKDEIHYIKNHCPLVEEKLELEKVSYDEQYQLQSKADTELEKVQEKLNEVENSYEESVKTNEKHIGKCELELQAAKRDLSQLKEKYVRQCNLEQSYQKKSEETVEKTQLMERSYDKLVGEVEKCKLDEIKENKLISEFQRKIDALVKEKEKLEKDIEKVEQSKKLTSEKRGKELQKLEEVHEKKVQELKETEEKNKSLQLDLQDINAKIKIKEKTIAKSKAETERVLREQVKNEEKITRGLEKIDSLKDRNTLIQDQIEKEEIASKEIEDNLKTKAEDLRKEVDAEMQERIQYEQKIDKNAKTLSKARTDTVTRKMKLEQDFKENNEALTKVKFELELAKSQHQLATEAMEEMSNEMNALQADHEKLSEELNGKKDKLSQMSTDLQSQHDKLKEELKNMKNESEKLKPQIEDMKISQNAMFDRMKQTESTMQLINHKLADIKFDYDGKEKVIELLKAQLEEAKETLKRRAQIHRDIMQKRKEVKAQLERGNQRAVVFNSKVADAYRKVQDMHMDLKNKILGLYDEKLIFETSIKDYKQLVEMQQKMNWALSRYYEDRSNFNEINLNKFKKRTKENSAIVAEVQKGLDIAFHNVEDFLKSHVDGSAEEEVKNAGRDILRQSQTAPPDPFKQKTPLPPLSSSTDGSF